VKNPLTTALEALSEAHGPSALVAAFRRLQVQVRKQRKREPVGKLASVMMEAIAARDRLKANGATGEDLDAGLAGVLRDVWPKGRERPWQHLCSACDDCGLQIKDCAGDAVCGRTFPHRPHTYGVPCWCDKGARYRPKPAAVSDELDSAAAKPRRPSRFGR